MLRLREKMHNVFQGELERSRLAMQWGGILGCIAHPLYFVIWTYVLPQAYDNLFLRLSAAVVCAPLVFQHYCSKRLQRYLPIYWHFALIYVLPFVCTFLTIKNSYSTMWMMTEVMMIFVMALCIEYPALLVFYIATGMLAAVLVAMLSNTTVEITTVLLAQNNLANLALLPIVILCSVVLSRAIQKGRSEAEHSRTVKALANGIAHEMRNPISHIKYNLGTIRQNLPDPNWEQSQTIAGPQLNILYQHISQGEVAVKRGLQLIDMILDDVKDKPLRPSDLIHLSAAKTAEKAIAEYSYSSVSERQKVRLDIQNDFSFKGNETLVIFIFFNLIKNALYYLPLKPEAEITITIDAPEIRVKDTGPGMNEATQATLFQAFKTGKADGTGLGLAYCQRTASKLGGTIRCHSQEGEYTEFILNFPPASAAEQAEALADLIKQANTALAGKRLLLVDDSPCQRQMTLQHLAGLTCPIDETTDGEEALAQLDAYSSEAKSPYALILMDLNMPNLDGYRTTESIRAGEIPNAQNIPILAYSSEPLYVAAAKTEKVGMNGYLSKPCRADELIRAILETEKIRLDTTDSLRQFLQGKIILVADDDQGNRAMLSIYLQSYGVHVIEAAHGLEVIQQLDHNYRPDALLLDIHMPGLNGVELVEGLRQRRAWQTMPIMAITGDFTEEARAAAQAVGFTDFLTKPIDRENLAYTLSQHFAQRARHAPPPLDPAAAHALITAAREKQVLPDSTSLQPLPYIWTSLHPLIDGARLAHLGSLPQFLERHLINWLAEIRLAVEALQEADRNQQIDAAGQHLHHLLGLTGTLGAAGLHYCVRHYYPYIFHHKQWPEADWTQALVRLHHDTETAFQNHPAYARALAQTPPQLDSPPDSQHP